MTLSDMLTEIVFWKERNGQDEQPLSGAFLLRSGMSHVIRRFGRKRYAGFSEAFLARGPSADILSRDCVMNKYRISIPLPTTWI
jgi:hypothetical protein